MYPLTKIILLSDDVGHQQESNQVCHMTQHNLVTVDIDQKQKENTEWKTESQKRNVAK